MPTAETRGKKAQTHKMCRPLHHTHSNSAVIFLLACSRVRIAPPHICPNVASPRLQSVCVSVCARTCVTMFIPICSH